MDQWKGNRSPDNPQEGYFVGLMNACGYRTEDLRKPIIGIANSYTDVNPGHRPFRELAEYFTAVTPAVDDAPVEKLAAALQNDIDRYGSVRAAADAASDRGAARICVWGEKVTRMLSSLVDRYLKEGESMLAGTDIWVCSTCGFVYIGDEAPELCPVCKVPAWKFEKIEGRA